VDSEAFRDTYAAMNPRGCVHEGAILGGDCGCAEAARFCLGEREGVGCRSERAQARCADFQRLLRQGARFALHESSADSQRPLAHGRGRRLQLGGLRGLAELLHPEGPRPPAIPDISALLNHAIERFGSLDALPFNRLMPAIAAYRERKRRARS